MATALGLMGELLITLGLVLALFVGYSLWWTDVVAEAAAGRQGDRLRQTWSAPAAAPGDQAPAPEYEAGDGVGFLHVPAFEKSDQTILIRMGTSTEVLNEGVAGVYEEPYRSAMPWDAEGNFALAAHRDGHGAKFHDLDRLGEGDTVVVETRDAWYVYRVAGTLQQTSKYNVGVVAPVPEGSPFTGPGKYLTLTSCTPVYTSRYRMAVWAQLVRIDAMDTHRTPPPEIR
ncbi:class E sortase [Kitasatospora sp. CB01950]|uniref:class E sortase n=1 Tax=Kitasatospora sp. CB01950 TaxID=1703930 RepID=UPI001F5187F9|nr:class E sortase [Kitasatospora sp. CB01950]